MEEIENEEPLPKFDHSFLWRRRDDRPWRHISPSKAKEPTAANRMEDDREVTSISKFRRVNKEQDPSEIEAMDDNMDEELQYYNYKVTSIHSPI